MSGSAKKKCCCPDPDQLCDCGIESYAVVLRHVFDFVIGEENDCDNTFATFLTQHPAPLDEGWYNGCGPPQCCFWDNRDEVGTPNPCNGTCALGYVHMVSATPNGSAHIWSAFGPFPNIYFQTPAASLTTTGFCPDSQSTPESSGVALGATCNDSPGPSPHSASIEVFSLVQQ